jgi:hypothetical protein
VKFNRYEQEEKAKRDQRIKKLSEQGVSPEELATRFGLSKHHVLKIVGNREEKSRER